MKSICRNQKNPNAFAARFPFIFGLKLLVVVFLAGGFSACSTKLESKVSGKLENISQEKTLAILPVETHDKQQKAMADMFRRALHAKLKESKFIILERYIVDGLLKQQGLTNPSIFRKMNPMRFGEILGVDAVLISQVNQVERSYFILHSSIEVGISAKILDTRSGELLWWAKQTEQDYQGLGKIPTGIVAAVIAPITFVTNKLNLNELTTGMVEKLTAIIKRPETAGRKETIKGSIIASATTKDIQKIKENQERNALREKTVNTSRA